MKKSPFSLCIILIFFLFFSQPIKGQFTVESIIFTESDTIECFLPIGDVFNNPIYYTILTPDGNKVKKNVNIENVSKLHKSGSIFKKFYYKEKPQIVKVLVDDSIKLYEYNRNSVAVSPYGAPSNNSASINASVYYIIKGNTIYKIKKKNVYKIRKSLRPILDDCPKVTEMINNLEESMLTYSLKKIINEYNKCSE